MSLNDDTGFTPLSQSPIYFPGGGGGGGGGGAGGGFQNSYVLEQQKFRNQQALQNPQLDLQRYLGEQNANNNRYATDQQAQTARQGNQLQYDASVLPANLKQGRFDTAMPYFQGAFGTMNQPYTPVGGHAPGITTGGVYDRGQIQQNVNAARAANDQTAETNVAHMRGTVAGRGYGSNSPLAMALEANYRGKDMAANTSNEREIRNNAAVANSKQLLDTQQAAEAQYEARQNEDIQRRKAQQAAMGTWLGALGSIV